MNFDVFITCAVTGAGDTVSRSPHVPVTPEQIAGAAIEAAQAGAAIAHVPVRDPRTGKAYMAMAALAGGNVRVGIEDNLFLGRGVPVTNGQLVERALTILNGIGARVFGPAEVREKLKLRAPDRRAAA